MPITATTRAGCCGPGGTSTPEMSADFELVGCGPAGERVYVSRVIDESTGGFTGSVTLFAVTLAGAVVTPYAGPIADCVAAQASPWAPVCLGDPAIPAAPITFALVSVPSVGPMAGLPAYIDAATGAAITLGPTLLPVSCEPFTARPCLTCP